MTQLCFVTLGAGASPLDAKGLTSAWAKLWPDEDPLTDVEGKEGMFAFSYMGVMATVGFMPGPIPWSDLEGPAETAWHWEQAVEVLKPHEAHMIVGVLGDDDEPSVEGAIRLTLLTAAVVAASPTATGVFWTEGTTVVPAERFVESAQEMSPEHLPLFSWIEFRVFPGDPEDHWNLFTTGMNAIGLMEIEVRDCEMNPPEIIERVYDIAHHLSQAGPVLKDGDTLGGSAEEIIRVHHVPSSWEREGPVLHIDF